MRYNLSLSKVLEDGTVVSIAEYKNEPGWFISPMLKGLADQTKEAKPKPIMKGEVPLFEYKNKGKSFKRAA